MRGGGEKKGCWDENNKCDERESEVSGGGLVFFFQAEDGIRDWSVTGVQTCALPI